MIKINKIYNENCLETMSRMDNNFIDLTVTSPPYDNLRVYNGYEFDFESIAKELYRVTKIGGVIVWVVADATIKGNETGTSFKQALFFKDIGFNLHDTMIWIKPGGGAIGSKNAYWQNFEYMFVFSKGKLKTFNPLEDKMNKVKAGKKVIALGSRQKDGTYKSKRQIITKEYGKRPNTWLIPQQKAKLNHPAPFPEVLAKDHILSWSNIGDLVYDPFMGSGTTALIAKNNGRNYIGSEMSEEYCKIIEERLFGILGEDFKEF